MRGLLEIWISQGPLLQVTLKCHLAVFWTESCNLDTITRVIVRNGSRGVTIYQLRVLHCHIETKKVTVCYSEKGGKLGSSLVMLSLQKSGGGLLPTGYTCMGVGEWHHHGPSHWSYDHPCLLVCGFSVFVEKWILEIGLNPKSILDSLGLPGKVSSVPTWHSQDLWSDPLGVIQQAFLSSLLFIFCWPIHFPFFSQDSLSFPFFFWRPGLIHKVNPG